MKPFIAAVFLFAVPAVIRADSAPRVIEISSRDLPLIGTVTFYAQDGSTVTGDWKIDGERYAWRTVPDNSFEIVLSSLTDKSERLPLFTEGNTFLPVNPTRPIEPDSLGSGAVPSRLPLVEERRNYLQVEAGRTGYVFVGTLENEADDSTWRTLYILHAETLIKPDANKKFRFSSLHQLSGAPDIKPEFVADFPLKLRAAIEGDSPETAVTVLRAGQKLRFEQVTRIGKSVYAKVTVL